jgi:hypothetical protein
VPQAETNHLLYLTAAGRHGDAAGLFTEVGEQLRKHFACEPQNLRRLRWIEGKILAASGDLSESIKTLHEVRDGFTREGHSYNSALLGLEIAGVNLAMGCWLPAQRLALEAQVAFEAQGVHPEAVRAASYLATACRQQWATAALAAHVVAFLDRLEWNSTLRFTAPMV